jgi:hypothetical protein
LKLSLRLKKRASRKSEAFKLSINPKNRAVCD